MQYPRTYSAISGPNTPRTFV
ncbi:hypothetical protein D039_5148A, partial [Vibrio parahaemolyticus EKP-028]